MEKLSVIISILFHDAEFSYLAWGFVGFLAGGWHLIYAFWKPTLNEKELIQVSPRFEGINAQYVLFMILWFFFMVILTTSRLDDWAMGKYGFRYYPEPTIALSCYGIFQGLFALIKGAYPQAKALYYVYEDERQTRRIAFIQIVTAFAVIVLSIIVFNILGTYYKVE